jgi:hypothetical protein
MPVQRTNKSFGDKGNKHYRNGAVSYWKCSKLINNYSYFMIYGMYYLDLMEHLEGKKNYR